MDDIRSGKVKAAIFLFFIVILIVGGYVSMIMLTRDTEKKIRKLQKWLVKIKKKMKIFV